MGTEIFTNGNLKLEVSEGNGKIKISFIGRSTDREPGKFLIPILKGCFDKAGDDKMEILMDFRLLEYMNSSTITPIIRLLTILEEGIKSVIIQYDNDLRWQNVIFSALHVFSKRDSRIEIKGSQK